MVEIFLLMMVIKSIRPFKLSKSAGIGITGDT